MVANPLLGVLFHWLGGLASGSFYVPYRKVKKWAWETYWLVGGFFSWIIAPWIMALALTKDLIGVLHVAPGNAMMWAYIFGALWGLGGLTFGLTMRYLGMSLGMAIALSYTAAFGTLVPPIFHGEFVTKILGTRSGVYDLIGVGVCLLGIACAGAAGASKDREMPEAQKREAIKEFNLKKGILVATFSGVMSSCFAFALDAAGPIKDISVAHGTYSLWQGLPALVVVLAGGFTTNFMWCVYLNIRNNTGHQYFSATSRTPFADREHEPILENPIDAPSEEMVAHIPQGTGTIAEAMRAPMFWNYLFSALAGVTWYMQFFFYTMGESQMGQYKFSSWTLHMASIIIFSTLWGIALNEWKGASARTKCLVTFSLAILISSTLIIGYGNFLSSS